MGGGGGGGAQLKSPAAENTNTENALVSNFLTMSYLISVLYEKPQHLKQTAGY